MNKMMVNHLGEDAERRRVTEWCNHNGITPESRTELMNILYGKLNLTKESPHDSQ